MSQNYLALFSLTHSNDYLFEMYIYLSSISGIQIRAQADDNDNVIVKFHSAKSSQYPGFSCRVSSQVKPFNQSSFGSVIDVGHIDVSESESTSPGNNSSTADNGSKLSEKHGTVLKLGFYYTILLKFPFSLRITNYRYQNRFTVQRKKYMKWSLFLTYIFICHGNVCSSPGQ